MVGGLGDESFDGYIGGCVFDDAAAKIDIAFGGEAWDIIQSLFDIASHASAANELQLVQLDCIDRKSRDAVDCLQYHGFVLAGESDDEMQTYRNAA